MTVDAGEVSWLKDGAEYAIASDAGVGARWGTQAAETRIVSPLALRAGAEAEAARQLAFLGGPLAIETHDVPGSGAAYLGTVLTIVAPGLGYAAGLDVFVVGFDDGDAGRTTLTVLRRL